MITTHPPMHPRNLPHPTQMSDTDRLNEAAHILANAIRRQREKQKTENFQLDNSPNQCPYGGKTTKGEWR